MPDGATPLIAAVDARRRREPGLTPNPVEDERRVREAARVAIDAGVDVNAADTEGNTALHIAARRHLDSVVQLLMDRGADPNAQNAGGKTPLALAAGADGDSADNSTVALLRTTARSTQSRVASGAAQAARQGLCTSSRAKRSWLRPCP